MFELGALHLQVVVVILQNLDQFLEIVDFLLIVQLDLVELNAVVVGYVGHLAQSTIFCDEILHLQRERVDVVHQLDVFLGFYVFFLAELINASDLVLCLHVTRIES